jgi:hypothetical protein
MKEITVTSQVDVLCRATRLDRIRYLAIITREIVAFCSVQNCQPIADRALRSYALWATRLTPAGSRPPSLRRRLFIRLFIRQQRLAGEVAQSLRHQICCRISLEKLSE